MKDKDGQAMSVIEVETRKSTKLPAFFVRFNAFSEKSMTADSNRSQSMSATQWRFNNSTPFHYGLKLYEIDTFLLTEPPFSQNCEWESERASEGMSAVQLAVQSMQCKVSNAVWSKQINDLCERTSKIMSEWPSTFGVNSWWSWTIVNSLCHAQYMLSINSILSSTILFSQAQALNRS